MKPFYLFFRNELFTENWQPEKQHSEFKVGRSSGAMQSDCLLRCSSALLATKERSEIYEADSPVPCLRHPGSDYERWRGEVRAKASAP